MELIQNNPFRVAGILSNATERELERQKGRFRAYARVGREIESDYDFHILENITRTEDSIDKAFANIQQSQDKVDSALFWFSNTSPFDNTAIEYLKNDDGDKAVEIWEKVTTGKEVNSKNFSAFNNLGTYKLLSRNKSDIKIGVEAKIKLIESEYFENFVHSVAGIALKIDNKKQSEKLIDELLGQFKNKYSSSEILHLFGGCNGTTQEYLSKKLTEEPIHIIESQIENCKMKRNADKGNAYEFGLQLFTNTKDDLSLLKSLLDTSDLKYKAVVDQLTNEIIQCGVDFFNESQENDSSDNYLESAQELIKLAESIAVGQLTKDRVKDSLATLADMKDRELNQAILVLQSIKDAYRDNERKIMAQVRREEANMDYGQSINWYRVRALIDESINWDGIIQLIIDEIPKENISKIKNSQNTSKKEKYKELVEFVRGKVDYSQKSEIAYLEYWSTPRKRPNPPINDGIPTWLKWAGVIVLFIILIKACN